MCIQFSQFFMLPSPKTSLNVSMEFATKVHVGTAVRYRTFLIKNSKLRHCLPVLPLSLSLSPDIYTHMILVFAQIHMKPFE